MECRAKIVTLGACGCGKSSILKKFVTGAFDTNHPATVGAAFMTSKIHRDTLPIHLDIWDTAGQERYSAIAPMYYRDAHTVIVVYDISDSASISTAKKWCAEVRMKNKDALLIVFGNKADLVLGTQQFRSGVHQPFSLSTLTAPSSTLHTSLSAIFCEYNAVHMYGSARTGEGIQQMFKTIGARTQYKRKVQMPTVKWWCF